MDLYKPGARFLLQGREVTVDFVLMQRGRMRVYLRGDPKAHDPSELQPLAPMPAKASESTVRKK
ncbi:hypothetical protein PY257_11060 [Ramlibacter sp. H39-3-26]|uniref:hypothetical protein n=1 Tax=Curvibacter soli TaxID=3031331 RepID=UPI0023D97EF8|nr:hypothetical protein [Ramlibacter sp. H39-3-26]MDF1485710.1 hypothetical protein [Ramlibacter sp. H39-3-26]